MNPDLRERWGVFRQNRRAWISLAALTAMFAVSLPAELLFNDKPIVLWIDGDIYWPLFRSYSLRDFGGDSPIVIENYKSPRVLNFLNGVHQEPIDHREIFGGEDDRAFDPTLSDEAIDAEWRARLAAEGGTREAETRPATPREHGWIWPPVRYNHRSATYNPRSGRENLAAPWPEYVASQDTTYPGAVVDGHWLGTDKEGKDVLARIVYGFRVSMLFGLGLALCGTAVGCILGAIQGYFGGWIDLLGQRFTEIWASLPRLYLLIILSSFLASQSRRMTDAEHYWLLFVVLNLTAWMGIATYIRAEFLKARNFEYVKAARALGVSNARIMFRHILPNSLTPVITFLPFSVTGGILALVSLDFLALGVRYPAPSLGELLRQGQENLHATWILVPTFLVLTVTLTLLTFIGDGIRDAFDPRRGR